MQFNHQSLLTRNTLSSLLSVKATTTQGLKVQTRDHNLDLGELEPVQINKHCDCNIKTSTDLSFGSFANSLPNDLHSQDCMLGCVHCVLLSTDGHPL